MKNEGFRTVVVYFTDFTIKEINSIKKSTQLGDSGDKSPRRFLDGFGIF